MCCSFHKTRMLALASALLALCGCRRDMQDQPKYKPQAASQFFADGRSARPIPAGTIAEDELDATDAFHTGYTGTDPNNFLDHLPLAVDRNLLVRGEERYNIFCSMCHGMLGDGRGMVARRGLKWPANLHTDRLRHAPPGYLYEVISNGYGAMLSYSSQVPPEDRWAIVAYIRALQLSRSATLDDVPPPLRTRLDKQP